jgi:hypothetical protein
MPFPAVICLVNLSAVDFQRKKNKWLPKIHQWVQVRTQKKAAQGSTRQSSAVQCSTGQCSTVHGIAGLLQEPPVGAGEVASVVQRGARQYMAVH